MFSIRGCDSVVAATAVTAVVTAATTTSAEG